MELNKKLETIVNSYLSNEYRFYKTKNANGESINISFVFKSRADFLNAYLQFYKDLDSLSQAIKYACCAKFCLIHQGETYELKHTHQEEFVDNDGNKRGVISDILEKMALNLLSKKNLLEKAQNFEDIINIVKKYKVPGFGELSIYDASVRIAVYLNIEPDMVYLHAGSRVGAVNLENKGLLSTNLASQSSIPLSDFPAELQQLKEIQVENILCAFKEEIYDL